MSVSVEIQGLSAAIVKFVAARAALSGDGLREAVAMGGLIIERDAKINAPVATGLLRASIDEVVEGGGTFAQATIEPHTEYAGYQEVGTKYMKGRFYMARAALQNTERVISLIVAAIRGAF